MKRNAAFAVLLAALAFGLVWLGWRCPLYFLTGHPCPTCGITRATRLALAGDLAGATRMHPLVWLAVPVVVGLGTMELVTLVRTRRWGGARRVRGADGVMAGTAALLFALWIARFCGHFGGPVP